MVFRKIKMGGGMGSFLNLLESSGKASTENHRDNEILQLNYKLILGLEEGRLYSLPPCMKPNLPPHLPLQRCGA